MGRYDVLNEYHLPGKDQIEQERIAKEAAEKQAQLERQEAEHRKVMEDVQAVSRNEYHKNLDARHADRQQIAAAMLEGDEQKQAELLNKAREKGRDPAEERNAAEWIANDPNFQQRHAEKLEQEQRPPEVKANVKERTDVEASKEASDKAREQGDKAQELAAWINARAIAQRDHERDEGRER
jgi:colicin import membrane protein